MEEESRVFMSTLREIYGRICWTHKTHEKAREAFSNSVYISKWISVVLTFLTLIALTASTRNPANNILVWVSILLAALTFAYQVFNLSFNPEKNESNQRNAAKALLRLREGYLILITRTMAGESIDSIKPDFEKLSELLVTTYSHLPDTTNRHFKSASDALKNNEEMTFSDKEIDLLLPNALRISDS